jgi:hypothetical protein
MNDRFDLWRGFILLPKEPQLTAFGKRWDRHPPIRWTPSDNPAMKSHRTEPTDPFLDGLPRGVLDMASTPRVPKFEDSSAPTAENGRSMEWAHYLPDPRSPTRNHARPGGACAD